MNQRRNITISGKAAIAVILAVMLLCAGLSALASDRYDLSDYGYRDVDTEGRGALIFQKSPRGSFMKNHKFYDGDRIYVNLYWRQDGYAMAYEDGEYGYVDASYIDWGSSSDGSRGRNGGNGGYSGGNITFTGNINVRTGPGLGYGVMGNMSRGQSLTYAGDTRYDNRGVAWYSVYYGGDTGWVSSRYATFGGSSGRSEPKRRTGGDKYDLSQYEYRQVTEKGRGALIFQKSPRGSFMKNYKYRDGDWIYVNVNWRQDGYAMAYEDGTYGYVDASYIDW